MERGPVRWWSVVVSLLVAALVVGLVVQLGNSGEPVVQPAAAERTPTSTPAREKTPDARGKSDWSRTAPAKPSKPAEPTNATRTAPAPTETGARSTGIPPDPVPAADPVPDTAAGAPASLLPPSVTFIGDSWTAGAFATSWRGYAVLAAEQLGWRSTVLGAGGSGYTRPGDGGTFDERVDRAVATHADVIVVQGSLNERHATPEELAPAARTTLRHLVEAADPGTPIVVVGASYTPGTPAETIDWINAAVGQAAAEAGLRFVDPAAEKWTDPAVVGIWADPNHPNDQGYQLVADHLMPLLRSVVGR